MSTPAECRRCGGRCRVATSKRSGDRQLQYLVCTACQTRAAREVPAAHVWRRKV